ncbi:MAG: RDD family protein [Candidatus Manganitrophaceae bacterium]
MLHRFIAKFIDLLIVAAIAEIPLRIGFLAGLSYLLIADGFAGGRSVGKQLIQLQTVRSEARRTASFRESIIRNFPFAAAYLFFQIPYIGWLFSLAIIAFEALLMIGNPRGLRVGDELAKTQVVDRALFESFEK